MNEYKNVWSRKSPYIKLSYSWRDMKRRCLDEKHPRYKRYGYRGIEICKDWYNLNAFIDWALNNGWRPGLTIDRTDNNGNYCPANCRWVSKSENSKKTSRTKISFEGAKTIRYLASIGKSDKYISKIFDVSSSAIWKIRKNIRHVDG
jgi:hypothetical protein